MDLTTLKEKHHALWEAIASRINDAVEDGSLKVERFFKYRVGSTVRDSGPFLVVLGRRLSLIQAGAHWRLGSLDVDFGVVGASLLPEERNEEIVDVMFALVDMFLGDTTFEGRAKTTTLTEMSLDDVIDADSETTIHSRASLSWQFEYMDNLGQ